MNLFKEWKYVLFCFGFVSIIGIGWLVFFGCIIMFKIYSSFFVVFGFLGKMMMLCVICMNVFKCFLIFGMIISLLMIGLGGLVVIIEGLVNLR